MRLERYRGSFIEAPASSMKVKRDLGGHGGDCGLGGKEKEGGEGVRIGRGTLEERLRALAPRKSRLGWDGLQAFRT